MVSADVLAGLIVADKVDAVPPGLRVLAISVHCGNGDALATQRGQAIAHCSGYSQAFWLAGDSAGRYFRLLPCAAIACSCLAWLAMYSAC